MFTDTYVYIKYKDNKGSVYKKVSSSSGDRLYIDGSYHQ
jgi:hypothetical protein